MAKENEIQFTVSLQNDASAVMKQFQKDVDVAMKSAGASTDNYGRSVQSLSGWIKAERAEQRQHNFLFAQTREVVAGASSVLALYGNTMGQTSEYQKMLTNSMNMGFVAFQGVNNVVGLLGNTFKFLSGPVGLTISLVSGLAVAFSQFSAEAEKSATNTEKFDERIRAAQISMGNYSKAQQINDFENKIAAAEAELYKLGKTVIDFEGTVKARAESGGKAKYVYKTIGTPEEIREQQAIMEESAAQIKKLNEEITKGTTQKSVIAKMKEDLEKLVPGTAAYEQQLLALTIAENQFNDSVAKSAQIVSEKLNPSVKETMASIGAMTSGIKTATNEWKAQSVVIKTNVASAYDYVQEQVIQSWKTAEETAFASANIVNGIMDSIRTGVATAFDGGEAAGKNFFKSLLNTAINFAEAYIGIAASTAWAKGVASFGTTIPADIALITVATVALETARSAVNKFHDGGTMGEYGQRIPLASDERPAILRVGETVLPTKPGESIGGSGTVININFNAPVEGKEFIRSGVNRLMRELGVSDISQVFVNQRSNLSLA